MPQRTERHRPALAGRLSRSEHHPPHRKALGSIPSQRSSQCQTPVAQELGVCRSRGSLLEGMGMEPHPARRLGLGSAVLGAEFYAQKTQGRAGDGVFQSDWVEFLSFSPMGAAVRCGLWGLSPWPLLALCAASCCAGSAGQAVPRNEVLSPSGLPSPSEPSVLCWLSPSLRV